MKIYDRIRCDLVISIATFMDEYNDQNPMSKYRQRDLETINMMIRKYDNTRDAVYLRREVKQYVSSLGSVLITWISSLSVNRLKQSFADVLNKPEYKKVAILRAMHGEERNNTLRVEEVLTSKLNKTKRIMQSREDKLTNKLEAAGDEIGRLKREIEFLTKKLVSCRKALDAVESKLDAMTKQDSGNRQLVVVGSQSTVLVKNSALWSVSKKPLELEDAGPRIGLLLE